MGNQKNHLNKMVLLSTHNMFWLRNKKIKVCYILLTKILRDSRSVDVFHLLNGISDT